MCTEGDKIGLLRFSAARFLPHSTRQKLGKGPVPGFAPKHEAEILSKEEGGMSKMDWDSAHEYPDRTQNVSTPEQLDNNFDAIVVGAGAAGGLAALLLCEGGARVLVLD